MLKDDFFSIINHTATEFKADFTIALNSNHSIYKAHFPNNPITPGVCIVQIAKELFSFFKQKDCIIKKMKSVKFINPIVPVVHNTIDFNMEWEENNASYIVKVVVCVEGVTFSKINMQLDKK